jgi:hypothetical protein
MPVNVAQRVYPEIKIPQGKNIENGVVPGFSHPAL